MKFEQVSDYLNLQYVEGFLRTNLSLLAILTSFIIISVATGQFSNYDSQLEYTATTSIIKTGLPYLETGNLINQPPLGFYIGALFLKCFGESYSAAVNLATVFGFACIILVYKIGKLLYGKSTGLLASALFALTPWHIVLSRSFLIDVQCLFLSLLYLLAGLLAIKKNSTRLFLVSGVIFGAAFLTKAFAVFMLVPLVLFYFYSGKLNLKRLSLWIGFFVPVLVFVFLWYQIISSQGFFAVFSHDDFNFTFSGVVPSMFFVINYLLGILGVFFLVAGVVSLLVSFLRRKNLGDIFVFDLICLATIVFVVGVNMFLALGMNLVCPYTNPIKYDYQSLPLICLLVASLINKFYSFRHSAISTGSKGDNSVRFIVIFGFVLIILSLIQQILILNYYSLRDVVYFAMDSVTCYSFDNLAANGQLSFVLQGVGFIILCLGILWIFKNGQKALDKH
jgi:hypothetical protein